MKSIITVLFVAAAVALLFWVARPGWDKILALRTERTDVKAALASLNDLQKVKTDLLATYDSIPKDKLDRLNELLPSEKKISDILVNFENLANERGMQITKIEFLKSPTGVVPKTSVGAKPSPAPEVSYKFSVTGSYESMKSLLLALEKTLRIVDVKTMKFGEAKKSEEFPEFNIEAKSYYQPQEEQI